MNRMLLYWRAAFVSVIGFCLVACAATSAEYEKTRSQDSFTRTTNQGVGKSQGAASTEAEKDAAKSAEVGGLGEGVFVVSVITDGSLGAARRMPGIFGALQPQKEVEISKVTFRNGVYKRNAFARDNYKAKTTNGYAVLKLPAIKENERYVLEYYNTAGHAGRLPLNCSNRANIVFSLNDGETIYLGHHRLSGRKSSFWSSKIRWHHSVRFELDLATKYLQRNYPELSTKVKQYKPEVALTKSAFGSAGYAQCS